MLDELIDESVEPPTISNHSSMHRLAGCVIQIEIHLH
jgi:hypothetical protein